MSSLDDKLKAILGRYETQISNNANPQKVRMVGEGQPVTIVQIKQAFTDANWFDVTTPEFEESLLKVITFSINGTDVKLEENHE
jgi:hypothetical protein